MGSIPDETLPAKRLIVPVGAMEVRSAFLSPCFGDQGLHLGVEAPDHGRLGVFRGVIKREGPPFPPRSGPRRGRPRWRSPPSTRPSSRPPPRCRSARPTMASASASPRDAQTDAPFSHAPRAPAPRAGSGLASTTLSIMRIAVATRSESCPSSSDAPVPRRGRPPAGRGSPTPEGTRRRVAAAAPRRGWWRRWFRRSSGCFSALMRSMKITPGSA